MVNPVSFTCRICQHTGSAESFLAREMMYGTGDEFSYVQCSACQTLQIEHIPDDLGRYYQDSYYSFTPVKENGPARRLMNFVLGIREKAYVQSQWYRQLFQWLLPPVEHTRLVLDALAFARASRSSKILDVGCGNGTILHRLKEGGFNHVGGVDPYIQQDIQYKNGLMISKKNLAEVEGKFDLITFHHSFEHVVDPIEILANAKRLLTEDGKILLRIPTVSSDAWDLYKTNWFQLDAPRHLYLFSRVAIELLAAKTGLQIAGTYDDSTAGQFLASEQYRQGIALDAKNSYLTSLKGSIFTPNDVSEFTDRAKSANAAKRGDQIVVLLTKLGTTRVLDNPPISL